MDLDFLKKNKIAFLIVAVLIITPLTIGIIFKELIVTILLGLLMMIEHYQMAYIRYMRMGMTQLTINNMSQ